MSAPIKKQRDQELVKVLKEIAVQLKRLTNALETTNLKTKKDEAGGV